MTINIMNMRNLFPGYYQPRENEFKEIWQECIFAFDANILLNIYRYTPKTRERFFDILSQLQNRIWVPYQAAYEYQKERQKVISQQIDSYRKIEKNLKDNLNSFKNALNETLNKYNKHAFLNINEIKKIHEEAFEEALKKSQDILNTSELQHKSENLDDLRDKLDDILAENIGNSYTKDELDAIYKRAEQRFNDKIPPGYKDNNKENPEKYGDFIIWQQLIDYAKLQKKPLVFITDDSKEDWWWIYEGKNNGPRPELVEEMQSTADVIFYMYSSDRFMDYAEKFLNLPHQQEAIEEARDIRIKNEEEQLIKKRNKQLEEIETFDFAKELVRQSTEASIGLKAVLEASRLEASSGLKSASEALGGLKAVLEASRLEASNAFKAALEASKIDPIIMKTAIEASKIDTNIMKTALEASRINLRIFETALEASKIDNVSSYAKALKYASARTQNLSSNNNSQENIDSNLNQ